MRRACCKIVSCFLKWESGYLQIEETINLDKRRQSDVFTWLEGDLE